MDTITIGQISIAITTIAGLISGIGFLHSKLKKFVAVSLRSELESINNKLESLDKKINVVDIEATKNYLVDHITEIERGAPLEEVERERFYEQYEHYTKSGGNSYITKKVERLEKDWRL